MKYLKTQSGFTLLEMIVTTTAITVLTVVISNFLVNSFTDWGRTDAEVTLQTDNQFAVEAITKAVANANAVLATNTISDPYGSWTSDANTLVLATPAVNSAGSPVYKVSLNGSAVCKNQKIIFRTGNKLAIRTLANTSSGCGSIYGNTAVSTCAIADACPDKDTLITTTTGSLTFGYENDSNKFATKWVTAVIGGTTTRNGKTFNLNTSILANLEHLSYQQRTFYFDQSAGGGSTGTWTSATNAWDGVWTTSADSTATTALTLFSYGTSALDTNGGEIVKVESRINGESQGISRIFNVTIKLQSGTETVGTYQANLCCGNFGTWRTLSSPSGTGWNLWSKIGNLEATVSVPAGAAQPVKVNGVELRVTTI